jgi:hypothetical protein
MSNSIQEPTGEDRAAHGCERMIFGRMIGLATDKAADRPAAVRAPVPDDQAGLADQSPEDTDAGWGERPEPDDDERRYGERPPHWEAG